MYRSLYFKIILILIIFVTTVMAVVGTVLIGGVSGYFTDDFSNQMDACFAKDSELWEYLSAGMESGEGAEAIFITLNAYFGRLGLDDYRECAVLSEDGKVLAASAQSDMFVQGETVTLTPNILSVMNGKDGRAQKSGASYLDYCVRLSGGEESLLIYVRDSKEEVTNLGWVLFSIILQALLFGAIFAVILSFFLAKTITAPIQSLTRGAKQLAAGEFTQTLDVHSHDEIGTLTDTFNHMKTVLKSTLDQVSGEREKLETVFVYLKDPVIAFGERGDVMHVNTTARDLFAEARKYTMHATALQDVTQLKCVEETGAHDTDTDDENTAKLPYSAEEELTLSAMLSLCGIDDTPELREILAKGLKENTGGYEIHEIALCGRMFDLSLGHYTYVEENHQHVGVLAVLHDVTGRYELDRSRREFVANVSHELRTPLTSIKGAAETVLRYPDMPDDMRESFLSMAVEESDRMTRIVGDLLVLSRLDNHRTKWEVVTFSIGDVLSHLCSVVDSDVQAHRHTLICRPEKDLPNITADKGRIEQVLLNILTNAVKYTPDGGEILVRAMAVDDFVGIAIRDNGIGIPADDVPHLFERFYRVEKSRTTGAGGTGLGLAIAKELIDAHGGSIHVESTVGVGTEITVMLPIDCRLPQNEIQTD